MRSSQIILPHNHDRVVSHDTDPLIDGTQKGSGSQDGQHRVTVISRVIPQHPKVEGSELE